MHDEYNKILDINYLFSLNFIKISIFAFLGYFIESKFKILQKFSYYLEKKQFVQKFKYEYRVFLPLIILEIPIILILGLFVLFNIPKSSIYILSFNFFISLFGLFLGQFIKLFSVHKDILKMDLPERENESLIRNINTNLLSKETSLNMGQIYSRLVLPYLFFILPFLVPLFIKEIFYVIPNYGLEKISIIVILSFISIFLRYLISKDNFYFDKINLYNSLFVLIKYLLCVIIVISGIYFNLNIYLFIIIIIVSSFIIPWHPYRFR